VEVLLSLAYNYDLVFTRVSRKLAPYGLTRASFGVLMILSRSDSKACKQNEISQLMLVSRANITGLVDGLARHGLVERGPDPHDRRVNRVKILAKGEKLLEALLPQQYQDIYEMFEVFSAAEKKTLSDLLGRLRKTMTGSKDDA
jgi:DNA-binding MarR family transcriptional regulator